MHAGHAIPPRKLISDAYRASEVVHGRDLCKLPSSRVRLLVHGPILDECGGAKGAMNGRIFDIRLYSEY